MNRKKLQRLSLTQIRPEGWLLDQLQIQMNGLSRELYGRWESLGPDSGWLGGSGESWERMPYYLDGLLPLAFYLNDDDCLQICRNVIEWTLNSQDVSGNFGPEITKNDQWSRFAMLKVLIQHEQITHDPRVIPFIRNYLSYMADYVTKHEVTGWSRARIPELLYSAGWLWERTGDDRILDQMEIIDHAGLDWCGILERHEFLEPASSYMDIQWRMANCPEKEKTYPFHETHIVNVVMGFKHPALRAFYCRSGDGKAAGDDYGDGNGSQGKNYEQIALEGISGMIRCHGTVSGCINGDEHLASADPRQGSELCSVVEYMFSLQSLLEVFGSGTYADLLERLAYNALPASISDDFMSHQYLQQANQIICDVRKRPWYNTDDDSNVFGLEPNFGCCCANMHQGWPKFVDSLWFTEGNSGIVSMVFAPCTVDTNLAGKEIQIRLSTEYPFHDRLSYRLIKAPAEGTTLKIRVPGWCEEPAVNMPERLNYCIQDGFIQIQGAFADDDEIEVTLNMKVRRSSWFANSVSLERGPLVFALDIEEEWKAFREKSGFKDYCIYPRSKWNYALASDQYAEVTEREISGIPFGKNRAPVVISLHAYEVPDWVEKDGNCADIPAPAYPQTQSYPDTIRLVPFGSSKLRIAVFPYCLS